MESINFDIPALEKLVENAPEELPEDRRTCKCGECDGYGHVPVDERTYKPCKNHLSHLNYQKLNTVMKRDHWDGWPPPTFVEMRESEGFVETNSFLGMQRLYHKILDGDAPFSVVLCGGYGRGKTLSSLILLREMASLGMTVTAIKFPDLVGLYKKGIDGKDRLRKIFNNIVKSKLVFIDEIGREPVFGNLDHARYALMDVADKCYRQRFLVLVSNMKKDDFPKYYHGNLASRMTSQYCKYITEPYDKDLRQKGGLF
jgi:DNA replication protein DnaC